MTPGQQPRQWAKVAGSSDNQRWEPQKLVPFDPNNPANAMIGYLKDRRDINGANGPFTVFQIQTVAPNGEFGPELDVSGGKVLEEALDKIALNSFICIKYLGKVASRAGGKSYNNWDVFEDKSAVPLNVLLGQNAPQASTFQQAPPVQAQQAPVFPAPTTQVNQTQAQPAQQAQPVQQASAPVWNQGQQAVTAPVQHMQVQAKQAPQSPINPDDLPF